MSSGMVMEPPRSWHDTDTHYLKAINSPWYQALVQVQDSLTTATMRFWTARGVRFGHLPVTTGSISSPMGLGSDSLPVSVPMFGVPTYLADSMQFGLEYLCRLSPRGAYYLMPSFRGEAADATHLCQFFHSEAEIPGGLDDVMAVVEAYVREVTEAIWNEHRGLITEVTGGDNGHVERLLEMDRPFVRLTFDEAVEATGGDPEFVRTEPSAGWRTITRAGERKLMQTYGEFLWLTHFDHLSVPFYQAYDENGKALNADLLFGCGEVVGAGERHRSGEQVQQALRHHEVAPESYDWYLQMKDVSPLQTAGFGLGVERYLMWLLKQSDIRDFQIFPRENGRNIVP